MTGFTKMPRLSKAAATSRVARLSPILIGTMAVWLPRMSSPRLWSASRKNEAFRRSLSTRSASLPKISIAAIATATSGGVMAAEYSAPCDVYRRRTATSRCVSANPPTAGSALLNVPIRISMSSGSRPKCSTVSPEHPDRVRIVDEEEGAVAPCQTGDLRERADVSVHGIHAVDRYQPPPNRGRPLEDEIQMVEVVVSEPTDGRAREKRAVVDGAMCLPVDDDQVPGSEQRGDQRHVGDVPAPVRHHARRFEEGRQPTFELPVDLCRPAEQAGASHVRTVPLDRCDGGGLHPRVVSQLEVAVRCEVDDRDAGIGDFVELAASWWSEDGPGGCRVQVLPIEQRAMRGADREQPAQVGVEATRAGDQPRHGEGPP